MELKETNHQHRFDPVYVVDLHLCDHVPSFVVYLDYEDFTQFINL